MERTAGESLISVGVGTTETEASRLERDSLRYSLRYSYWTNLELRRMNKLIKNHIIITAKYHRHQEAIKKRHSRYKFLSHYRIQEECVDIQ
jgi:hypothetical protein